MAIFRKRYCFRHFSLHYVNVWYSGKLPLYVSDLISVTNTSTSNKFAWNGAPDATGYEVYQGTSPSDPKKKKIGDTKNTYFTNSNKSTGTMYKYMVRATVTLLASVFTAITLMFSPPARFLRTSQRYPLLQGELLSPLAGTKFQRRPTTSWSIM